jgi:hypothetical protein
MRKSNIQSYSKRLKAFWNAVYDTSVNIDEVFEQFIHEQYSQCINGVTIGRIQYKQHVLQQRKLMTVNKIEYVHILEKDDELFALYYPEGTNSVNMPIKAEVIAYFQFCDEKLLKIQGQVQLIEGSLSDIDMKES